MYIHLQRGFLLDRRDVIILDGGRVLSEGWREGGHMLRRARIIKMRSTLWQLHKLLSQGLHSQLTKDESIEREFTTRFVAGNQGESALGTSKASRKAGLFDMPEPSP
jgi:hypothetical protein